MANKKKYKFQGVGLTRKQTYAAKKKFKTYIDKHDIESYSDLQLLEELIYREVQTDEIKEKIKSLQESDNVEQKHIVPKGLTKALDENLENIIELKEKLGLFKEKKTKTFYKKWNLVQKKYKKWLEENQASREFFCAHCSKPNLLVVKKEHWKNCKHPWFKDRRLFNLPLFKLYLQGKITKKETAEVLGTSPDYIDWIIEKSKKTPEFKKMKKELEKNDSKN